MKSNATPKVLKSAALALLFIMFIFTLNARDIVIGENGQTAIKVKVNTYEKLLFSNSLDLVQAYKVNTEKGMFSELHVTGYAYTYVPGAPKLPVNRKLIEIPIGAVPRVNIISYELEEYDLIDFGIQYPLMPAQPPAPKDGTVMPFEYDASAYTQNSYSDDELVTVDILGMMRGLRIARVNISPIQYNPVSGKIRVYSNIEVEVLFDDADVAATLEEKKKNEAPYFRSAGASLINYKTEHVANRDTITKYPVKFVIVSDPMFEAQLQPYIEWKSQKGFTVVEAYTDDGAVGNTTTSIKAYLQGLYDAGTPSDPAPSFVLFVGDVAQIPAWSGNTSFHVTDLMYVEYTGDYFPEVYYGRWSASNPTELQPQIDKTLQYEKYTMPDPSYLDEVVMIAGMDGSHGADWGNGQINYGTENYFNAAHGLTSHTYLYPESGSNSANIIQNISDGVGFANYTAHCSANGWADPSFSISDVAGLQNADQYGVLIGNCCSSNEFDNYCFGEAILRAADKGAVGYIGGTNSTYWDEDYYFGVGVGAITEDPPSYAETTLGNYDRSFHDHGEPWEDWYTTTYQIIFAGNLAVTEGSPGSAEYYWEIYSVMGDPSVMTYYGVPDPLSVSYDPLMPLGSTSFTVTTDPYAYVGISKDGVLHGAALADASGIAVVNLDPIQMPGEADVVVTKQNAQPYIGTVLVNNPAGPFVVLADYQIDDAAGNNDGQADYGESILLDVDLENLGAADALDVEATISSNDEYISITDDMAVWGTIAAGATSSQADAFAFDVDAIIPDQHSVTFELDITGNGKENWNSTFAIVLNAPVLEAGMVMIDDSQAGNGNGRLDPGETADIVISVANNGHTDAIDAMATLNSSSTDIVINNGSFNMGGIAMGASQEATFNISVDDNINPGVSIQFEFNVDADGYTAYKEFFLVAGQIPVLIVDLDPNNSSAPEMNLCFGNLNVGADYATSIPADLPMYSSVFVCLGIYNANTALSSTDGQALADYLAGGGNLYMEGGDTWYYDAQTAVHPMFGITGIEDGTDDLGTLLGQTGTFTEGMTYSYGGENNWIDHIAPNGSAFLIFNNESPSYGTGVANIGSTYRTIGCSHEFGGLEDGAFTKDYLMYKYLQFFGIDAIWVGLEEIALSENAISIYPNPVTNSAMVRVNVAEAGTLSLAVFNSKGQKISVLADNKAVTVGEQGFEFDASAVPGGIYYCVLSSGDQKVTKKIVVIK
jgi:hypothetical protein